MRRIRNYVNRCVEFLEASGADKKIIDALKKVPLCPAENIYEAIVSWNFILYLDNCDNLGCVASGLYPYYNGECVIDLLKNLYDNLDANDGYSMALGTDYNPLPLRTLLVDDCIDNGIEFNSGGARYKWSIVNFAGMINVIDAMLVIRDFIFEEKLYDVEEFVELLQTNNKEFLE